MTPGDPDAARVTEGAGSARPPVLKERYQVERELGRGGMSIVYLARDLKLLGKRVVIKVLLDESTEDEWIQRKFQQEMEALARIDHPGVIGALDAGEMPDGKRFLVMQYVEGENLRSAFRSGPLALPRAAHLLRQIASALGAAHEKQVWHRDLKPENIMVQKLAGGEEHVKLIDFGIAGIQNSVFEGPQTKVAGSLSYMAPEQFAGHPSELSDIYALGIIAYEMVTGHKPFSGQNMGHLISADGARPELPESVRTDLPPAAGACILKAMAFHPQNRYRSALEFAEDFARSVNPAGGHAEKKPLAKITGRPEMAHVLFTDLVGYSQLSMDVQRRHLDELQQAVRQSPRFRDAEQAGEIIRLPTGDGVALAFFGDPSAPAQCAVEIAAALRGRPHLRLRMGIHSGPVFRVADINTNINVSGGGINMAQRVMDCGDAGHILVSKTSADVLAQLNEWSGRLTSLGEIEVKHGVRLHIYNLVTEAAGNAAIPKKVAEAPAAPAAVREEPVGSSRRTAVMALAGVAVLAAAAGGWYIWRPGGTPPDPRPAAPALELHYAIQVQRMRDGAEYGAPVRLVGEMLFEKDYRIALEFFTTATGQLYILNHGKDAATGRTTLHVLQPRPNELPTVSAGAMIRVPPAGWFQFDAAAGKEILYVVWSKAPVPELETAREYSPDPEVRLVALKTPEQMDPVLAFLEKHKGKQLTIEKNEQARRTELRTSESVLVHEIGLEHQ
jgi:serine/threonine-protein kinase